MRKKEHSGSAAVIGAQLVILYFDGFPVRSEQKSGGGEYICGDGEER